ncbi:hypothetical protein Dda_3843 [Drechslerella dactyloides]|uniref:Uncharacterized protein n=1 Tax=Drechslerella dactyloides TaxID=74499 RepID=A0AAD6NIW2_DREDA|nr:hypothetical protein Dda_3843 [Drechslerella dactyloides]
MCGGDDEEEEKRMREGERKREEEGGKKGRDRGVGYLYNSRGGRGKVGNDTTGRENIEKRAVPVDQSLSPTANYVTFSPVEAAIA